MHSPHTILYIPHSLLFTRLSLLSTRLSRLSTRLSLLFTFLSFPFAGLNANHCIAEELRVPAFTAYMLPNPESARVSEQKGITRWNDPAQSVNWYGKFASTGELTLRAEMCLPMETKSRFRLNIREVTHEAIVTGLGIDHPVIADFGVFKIATAGHQRIQLESMQETKGPIGDIKALLLEGPASENAHFNLKERRKIGRAHV